MSRATRNRLSFWERIAHQGESSRNPRRFDRLVPLVEGLERRIVLTAYAWNTTAAPSGGDWDVAGNWTPAGIPGTNDTATINLAVAGLITHNLNVSDSVISLTTNSNTTFKLTAGTFTLGAGSSTLGGPTTIYSGATLNALSGASVSVGTNQVLSVNAGAAMTLAAGDTLTLNSYSGTGYLDVSGTLTAAAGNDTFNGSGDIVVYAGGELTASGDTFAASALNFNAGAVVAPTDLSKNTFSLPITIPAASVPMLAAATGGSDNRSFEAINILAGTQPEATLDLDAIGTATTAGLSYVFPGGFNVPAGSTLAVAANVPISVGTNQVLSVNAGAAMTLAAGDTLTLNSYSGTGYLDVSGTLTATGATFNGAGDVVVQIGGHLTASASGFKASSLIVQSGAYITLTTSSLATQFAVNSGATYSVSGNDFSNIGANGVVASGDANAHIPLTGNYWGSTVPATISAKIEDHADNSALPTVDYQPFLSYTTGTLAASKSASFQTTAQTVTLTATVSSTSGLAINEGTETFTILNGTQVIGSTTAPVNVSNSAATATFTLPAYTAPGIYTIVASYSGSANYEPASDSSQFLTVKPATTTTTVAAASINFQAGTAQSVPLSVNVTSPGGTPNEGTVTFTILAGSTPIGSSISVPVAAGGASTNYPIPANTPAGAYTIQTSYNDPADYAASTGTATLTVHSQATTITITNAAATFTALGAQQVSVTAQVVSPGGTINEGYVNVTIQDSLGKTVGSAVSVTLGGGSVTVNYTLPAGTPAGTYVIQAAYVGTSNFQSSTATPGTLALGAAATTVATDPPATTFSESAQTLPLSATVTSAAATSIGVGTVTFTIQAGGAPIVVGPVAVAGGRVNTTCTLPASLPVGIYSVQTVYSGGGSFLGYTDTTQFVVVGRAATSVSTDPDAVSYDPSASETVSLDASVTSQAGRVDAPGSVTFQVFSGSTPIGSPVTVDVVDDIATGSYVLPSGLATGSYSISTVFSGTGNFAGSGDRSAGLLLIGSASTILATAGTPQSAVAGSAFASPLQATVDDKSGNPVGGVLVTFAALTSGPGGSFAAGKVVAVMTNSLGVAVAPAFTADTVAGAYNVIATVAGASTFATFNLTNTPGAPAIVVPTAGSPQSGTVATAFPGVFQATVEDQYGNPVGGATLTFAAPTDGSTGTFAGNSTVTELTNSLGIASAPTFTAGTVAGSYSVTATIPGASPAAFSLTNLAGAASTIVTTAGTPQSAAVGTNFAVAMQATVEDKYGNPVAGMSVTFAAPTTGAAGTFAAGKTVTVTTNSLGIASAPTFTAGTVAGSYSVTATIPGASPAAFSLTNLAGAASTIVTTAGTPQSAAVGTNFAVAMQATVEDKYGNPVAGVSVTFASMTLGAAGTFAAGRSATVTTSSLGVATAPTFSAGTVAGTYGVTATVADLTPASFSLTNLAGAASTITITAGAPQSAAVGTLFATSMQATVKDKYGNPVSGALVTFAAPSSGPSGTFTAGRTVTVTTNSLGVAIAPLFEAGTVAGTYNVTATVTGVSTTASFSLTNTAGAAATIVTTAGTPQSALIGTNFATLMSVVVKDKYGNVVAGASVTFSAPTTGAGGTFAGKATVTVLTNSLGVATATTFAANSKVGTYAVKATVAGLTTLASFNLTNIQ